MKLGSALTISMVSLLMAAKAETWNVGTGNWSSGGNWVETSSPLSDPATELTFGGSGSSYTSSNDLGALFELGKLTLNYTGGSAAILTGDSLKFGGTSGAIEQNQSGDFEFDLPLDFQSPVTFSGDGSGAVILNGTLSGVGGLTKSGTSTLRIGSESEVTISENTFHGGLRIDGGTLNFVNDKTVARTALRSNPVTFGSSSATLQAGAELRCGEITGASGSILGAASVTPFDGQNILIFSLKDTEFGGTLSTLPIDPSGMLSGTLTVRGVGVQTLSGTVKVNESVIIATGAGLKLSGWATLMDQRDATINLNGGKLILDNTGINGSDRIRNVGSNETGVDVIGGGTFSFIGNAIGSTETIGRLQLGGTTARSGMVTVNVTHNGGAAAPTILSIADYARDSVDSPHSTVDFTAQDGAGRVLALGRSGNQPRILFKKAPPLHNGLLSPSNSEEEPSDAAQNEHVGWATVNGSSFATHGGNGIAAVATTPFVFKSQGAHNVLLSSSAALGGASAYSFNSLKIAPGGSGQSLRFSGSAQLRTNALLLAGSRDYSIVNSGVGNGTFEGRGGSRYIFVQQAMLTIGLQLDHGDPLTLSGQGTLVLTHPSNHLMTKALTLNGGTVRATPGSSLPGGRIEFRGGVLELTGGGTYSPSLGSLPGNINWRADREENGQIEESQKDEGSGGFAAYGAPVSVTVIDANNPILYWEDPFFIDSNHSLIFGSPRADSRLTFTDDLCLHRISGAIGAPGSKNRNYSPRQIRVIDNPNSTEDFVRMSGEISGPVFSDLLKSGAGILELTHDNSALMGGVIVAEGSLLTSHSLGLGSPDGAYILLGARMGTTPTALFTSHSSGSLTIARDIHVQSGGSGAAVLGNTVAPDQTSAGDANFSGEVSLGLSGDNTDRTLVLHAEAGTTVRFTGGIKTTVGYLGKMGVETSGAGAILLESVLAHTGMTKVGAGTLTLGAADLLPSTSALTINSATIFSLGGFNQSVGSIAGAGTLDLGAGLLRTGLDDTSSTFSGAVIGNGGLTKVGAGALTLTGSSSYSGPTSIVSGSLVLENLSGSATGTSTVEVLSGGKVTGKGFMSGSLVLKAGAQLSPGTTIGRLTSGPATYSGDASYLWQIRDATPGTGQDSHLINGVLTIDSTSSDPFVIQIVGLDKFNLPGKILRFNPATDYAWTIASASGGISGFSADKFLIQTTDFASGNPFGSGTFQIVQRGNNLVLLYTGVPAAGAGSYNGLITNLAHANAGYIRVQSTSTRSFSASLRFAGSTYAIRGTFPLTGSFTRSISRSNGLPPILLTLTLDSSSHQITGSVFDGTVTSSFTAKRTLYHSTTSPAPQTGRYSVVLPPDPAKTSASFPQGYGSASLNVKSSGAVSAAGRLADGSTFSVGALLDVDGSFPFYVGLYSTSTPQKGSLRGTIQFQDTVAVSDLDGLLVWDKPAQIAPGFFPAGFSSSTLLIGSKYLVVKNLRLLNFSTGSIVLSGGNLNSTLTANVALSLTHQLTVTDLPNLNRLSFSLASSSGLFTGSFFDPTTSTFRTIRGSLFQKQNLGFGYFLGTDQSGSFQLSSP